MCDNSFESYVSNFDVILKSTFVPIKPSFNNPTIGQTSKSPYDSRKKPWLNKKDIVYQKIEARNAIKKETRSRHPSRFVDKPHNKVSQKVNPTTRNHNAFIPVKILKRSSIHANSNI